jgi:hypothetical protein
MAIDLSKYYEYEPKEVSQKQTFEDLAALKVKPEEIPNLKERAAYIKFLETFDADAE